MHFSDQPIARPSEDFLGRKTFALALARAVDTLAPARDGFVIASENGVQGKQAWFVCSFDIFATSKCRALARNR
jgi:hypothetical protein